MFLISRNLVITSKNAKGIHDTIHLDAEKHEFVVIYRRKTSVFPPLRFHIHSPARSVEQYQPYCSRRDWRRVNPIAASKHNILPGLPQRSLTNVHDRGAPWVPWRSFHQY